MSPATTETGAQIQMNKATLKIKALTDRVNGYGMPVVEVTSDSNIIVINRGYNVFEAQTDIDESDLLRLRTYYSMFSESTVMLEITLTTGKKTNCWYSLEDKTLGKKEYSNIIW